MGKKRKPPKGAAAEAPAAAAVPASCSTVTLSASPLHPPPGSPDDEATYDPSYYRRAELSISEHRLYSDGQAWVTALAGFMPPSECAEWQAWALAAAGGFERAYHTAGAGYAHRDCQRLELHDEERAGAIWERLRPFVPATVQVGGAGESRRAVGCLPCLRVYTYGKGQRFGPHVDMSTEAAGGGRTEVTVLIYLNGGEAGSELRGGATTFYRDHDAREQACAFTPRAGWCLLHSHGDWCLTHEGSRVEAGLKLLLRTDVVYE